MIKSFKCKETEKIFNLQISKKLPNDIQQVALRKLKMLNRSVHLNELRIPPSNHLERLSGNTKTQWSIWINKQWRICFNWTNQDAHNVEIIDYH